MILEIRQQVMLQALRKHGRLSRWELHDHTGIRPNTVGTDVGAMLEAQVVRECQASAEGRGRPRVPLEIDDESRHVIGLAIRPGHVEIMRMNLLGKPIDDPIAERIEQPDAIASTARRLLESKLNSQTLNIGLSTPGFVDPIGHQILFSSAMGGNHGVSLQPLYDAAGNMPLALENDMHALAARWLLTHEQDQDEDVLLVYMEDGQLGAAILINGRPNRGCVIGGNELGHTRLPVETEKCYCGYTGCLERIGSSAFLTQQDNDQTPLADRVIKYDGSDNALNKMIDLLATGISNAVNFIRPNRVVLVSELVEQSAFATRMLEAIHSRILDVIAQRTQIEMWDQPAANPSESAGWLALANFYYQGWDQYRPQMPEEPEADATKQAATEIA
jgi:predicted NBD/HSP70 family sugar kinase